MNAYEIPDAIQWHEGLLLTPQHFQQMSARHEALVQYRAYRAVMRDELDIDPSPQMEALASELGIGA